MGDLERVLHLVESGASVNAPFFTQEGGYVTLLHLVGEHLELLNAVPIFLELLRGKANLNARSSTGCTPLISACLHKNLLVAQALLDAGADVSPANDDGLDAIAASATIPRHICEAVPLAEALSSQLIHLLVD